MEPATGENRCVKLSFRKSRGEAAEKTETARIGQSTEKKRLRNTDGKFKKPSTTKGKGDGQRRSL